MSGSYDVGQICLNGHTVNASSREFPQHNKNFCDKCGAATTTTCQACGAPIQGEYYVPGFIGASHYSPPAFCHNCGKPYPWTEARLKAARDLSDELDNLSDDEKENLKRSVDDIVRDTPQATVAAARFKKLIAKAGKTAADGFREILVDVVGEAAKRTIWG
jgi:hypothetical protein